MYSDLKMSLNLLHFVQVCKTPCGLGHICCILCKYASPPGVLCHICYNVRGQRRSLHSGEAFN